MSEYCQLRKYYHIIMTSRKDQNIVCKSYQIQEHINKPYILETYTIVDSWQNQVRYNYERFNESRNQLRGLKAVIDRVYRDLQKLKCSHDFIFSQTTRDEIKKVFQDAPPRRFNGPLHSDFRMYIIEKLMTALYDCYKLMDDVIEGEQKDVCFF